MSAKTQLQGIHQGELPMLKPILQKWIDLNRNLANEFILDSDVPWWYNERPHVGLLAGAIWQSGGWAFQEYGIERQIKQQRGMKYKAGRRDIDFTVANHYFTAEAKQAWPTLGKNRQLAPVKVQECLSTACKEAAQYSLRGCWQLGLVFATPRVPVSSKDEMDNLLWELLSEIRRIPKVTVAWYFSNDEKIRFIRGTHEWSKIYFYPGIILVAKPVRIIRQ